MENQRLAEHKKQKALALGNSIINTALAVTSAAKQMPSTAKHPFRKDYNRRPRNKQKKAVGQIGMLAALRMGAIQSRIIMSQPLPMYNPGGIYKTDVAFVNNKGEGIVINGKVLPVLPNL